MSDEESNSEAENSCDVNDVVRSLSDVYDRMYLEWIKMNKNCKKMQTQISKLFHEKLRFENEAISLQTTVHEKKMKAISAGLESTQKSLRIMNTIFYYKILRKYSRFLEQSNLLRF